MSKLSGLFPCEFCGLLWINEHSKFLRPSQETWTLENNSKIKLEVGNQVREPA